MRLRVAVPYRVVLDEEVDAVSAEGLHGSFTMLPRHIDYLVMLRPGILTSRTEGEEKYLAIDGGTLVKVGDQVRVSTWEAVAGDRLEQLEQTVRVSFRDLDQQERQSRAALARIESRVMRDLFDFEEES